MKFLILSLLTSFISSMAVASLTIYSDRPDDKMSVIVQAFEEKTGVTVNAIKLSATDIEAKLVAEGADSPADIAIAKDLVYMNNFVQAGVLSPLNSTFADANVDASMRSEFWTAITYRARTLVHDIDFDVSEINTYADLADPKYEGTLCLRTSKSTYNQSLAASLIDSYGEDEAAEILSGWLDNLADFTVIHTSDSQIIRDIALQNTTCTLGMTNSYYLGLLLLKDPDLPVGIKFLDLKEGGSSTNGIGAGITAASKNKELAREFIEFMLSEPMQKTFSTANQDFPANRNVEFPENIKAWAGFKTSNQKWDNFVEKVPAAIGLFEELDYL